MSPLGISRDALAHIGTGVSGGGVGVALSTVNEIVQIVAGLVAIAAGVASLVHFLKQRKRK